MNTPTQEQGRFFLSKVEKLFEASRSGKYENLLLFRLFTLFWEEITDEPNLQFTALFSRIAFASSTYKIQGKSLFLSHRYRRLVESGSVTEENSDLVFDLGLVACREIIIDVFKLVSEKEQFRKLQAPNSLTEKNYKVVKFYSLIRVAIIDLDEENLTMDFVSNEEAHIVKKAVFDIEGKNDSFNSTLLNIRKFFKLPIIANLIDVELDEDDRYIPGGIVLLPDFLMDATSLARLYSRHGVLPIGYLLSKFVPIESNKAILMGNIANAFLDRMVYKPEISFGELQRSIFAINPLLIAQFEDSEVKELLRDAHMHYRNIREVIHREMVEQEIQKESVFVEPSFLSNTYGFQGRLDLLHLGHDGQDADIIELKSGSPYKANSNGISEPHYRQLLIYDLMIRGTIDSKVRPKNFILYSKLKERRLRFAGSSKSHQLEILKLRNTCIFFEQVLLDVKDNSKDFFEKFDPRKMDDQFRFEKRDAEKLYIAYKKLDGLEKSYIKHFTSFISREYQLSKTGEHGIDRSNGMAGLWLDPIDEKIEQFRMWSMMEIDRNEADQKEPYIYLRYSAFSNKLCRFRVGDVVVLYPNESNGKTAIAYQLFKASIIDITDDYVQLRLRAQQLNLSIFRKYRYWNVEADFLQGSTNKMFQGLYHFMNANPRKRNLILCREAPAQSEDVPAYENSDITAEQQALINKIIAAKDYFLLWGPPGTGKTNVMLKSLVQHHYENTSANILLLAYTNRAVDEICGALEMVSDDLASNYLRIGSRYSTSEHYQKKMLSVRLEEIDKRSELLTLLQNTRVFTSTVSSMLGKMELLKLKTFDLVIIDEASQLLEPMLLGLLSVFTKVVMIGDHKQLPAVVTQAEHFSKVEQKELHAIGLQDMRESLFQRMYTQAIKNNWDWSYGILKQQGRMHQDIMKFPASHFYDSQLKILDFIERLSGPLNMLGADKEFSFLETERMIFIDTPTDEHLTQKVNQNEALKVIEILAQLDKIYKRNQLIVDNTSFGVITPFRAQIAKIRQELLGQNIDYDLTIDTVERFQGGARDRIIISLVTNDRNILQMISNKSIDGIDRKLNVAITRAREQLILIGNKDILSHDQGYKKLIESCFIV